MLDWLFRRNKSTAYVHANEEFTIQDSMDMLIRKIVPEKYLVSYTCLGTLTLDSKKYHIDYKLYDIQKKCSLSIWYSDDSCYITSAYGLHRPFTHNLRDQELCAFINEHFNEITNLIQDYVDNRKKEEQCKLDQQIKYVTCQMKLTRKIQQYCNQNL